MLLPKPGKELLKVACPCFSLGRNTPLASAPVRCIPFSLRHVALRDHLAQAREAVVSQNGKVTWTDGRAA